MVIVGLVGNELSASKASYSTQFNTAVWITTSGAQYALGWWFGKQAVFYLPPGWFGPAEWWLGLLFAPMGRN
jgi:tail-anchored protein insertion receptor